MLGIGITFHIINEKAKEIYGKEFIKLNEDEKEYVFNKVQEELK